MTPVALITGAASGIGEAASRRLSAAGAHVVLVDLDTARAQALADALPGEAIAVAADVSLSGDVDAYTAAAISAFGRIDQVFLNAGIPGMAPSLVDETPEGFDRIIAVNLRGVFLGLRAALAHMASRPGGGAIVVTASTAGVRGSHMAAYSAAKHGVVALVQAAAVEAAPYGVRVNAIAPGSIDTPMMRSLEQSLGGGEEVSRALHATTPIGKADDRFGRADEVAAVVEFLLGPNSSWVTGTTVPVEGGVLATDPYRGTR
jgi:NAD(P)-dependent dehydrogenase (short-subunit alcohol dehydrogenase family)